MGKTNIHFIMGEPGTGKSSLLIKKAIEMVHNIKSLYIMTPTNVAKHRLIKGFNQNYSSMDSACITDLIADTSVLQYQYAGERNIFIDEVSMLKTDDLYALFYKIQQTQYDVDIYAFGDVKQLPAIGTGILQVLFNANAKKFPLIKKDFWAWVNNYLYEDLPDEQLDIPSTWKTVVKNIDLKILRKNYRLKNIDGIQAYNNEFLNYAFREKTQDADDYSLLIENAVENHYLMIVPTHSRGAQVNEVMKKKYGDKMKYYAPFITRDKKIFKNMNCKINYGFNFVKSSDSIMKNIKPEEYTFYVTAHAVQGCEVDRVCFYLGKDRIGKLNLQHYNKNLLYVALSRGRKDWLLLGEKDQFLLMTTIEPENPSILLNHQKQQEALEKTIEGVALSKKIMDCDEIYELYLRMFDNLIHCNTNDNKDVLNVSGSIDYKPYTKTHVLSMFDPTNHTNDKYSSELMSKGYGFLYADYCAKRMREGNSKGGKKGGKINGKISETDKWMSQLSSANYEKLKNDYKNMSTRVFQRMYGHTKRSVGKYLK